MLQDPATPIAGGAAPAYGNSLGGVDLSNDAIDPIDATRRETADLYRPGDARSAQPPRSVDTRYRSPTGEG